MEKVKKEIEVHLSEIAKMFKPHCQMTFMMINPEVKNGGLLITNNSKNELIASIEKTFNPTKD